jgi:hypothetical protein
MDHAAFWRDEAKKLRHRAHSANAADLVAEFEELAEICERVAEDIEDRATAG